MGLSREEVLQYLEANPEAKFAVRTDDEEKSFLDNFKQSEVEKALGDHVREIHSKYDADIYEITGQKKDPTEKTYDFNKRILKGYIQKVGDLEKKVSQQPVPDERVRELEGVISTIKKEKDEAIAAARQETISYKTRAVMDTAIAKLPINPTVPEKAREALMAVTLNKWLSRSNWEDDRLVFKDEKGETIRNSQTYNPVTAEELFAEELADILKKDRTLPGKDIPPPGKPGNVPEVLPAHITSKVQLTEYLNTTLRLKRGSEEYKKLYAAGKDLPLQ